MNWQPQVTRIEVRIPPGVKTVSFPVLNQGNWDRCEVAVDPQEPTFHRCELHDLMIVPTKPDEVKG